MKGVPIDAVSVSEARMKFRVNKVKDTMVEGKKLKHIQIQQETRKSTTSNLTIYSSIQKLKLKFHYIPPQPYFSF